MIVQGGGGSNTGRIATDDNAAISQNNRCKMGSYYFTVPTIVLPSWGDVMALFDNQLDITKNIKIIV